MHARQETAVATSEAKPFRGQVVAVARQCGRDGLTSSVGPDPGLLSDIRTKRSGHGRSREGPEPWPQLADYLEKNRDILIRFRW
jgi:hypothetical protein